MRHLTQEDYAVTMFTIVFITILLCLLIILISTQVSLYILLVECSFMRCSFIFLSHVSCFSVGRDSGGHACDQTWIGFRSCYQYAFISCNPTRNAFRFLNSFLLWCRDANSVEESTAKLMKVAWLTFPLGVVITLTACYFVFWWQELSFSDPYGQAILINGNLLVYTLLWK